MEIQAAVVMLPGDAFVKAVSKVLKRPYGGVRVISDICMALGAAVICLCFTGELSGVREGTIVAAVITGNIVKILGKFKIEC